MYRLLTFFSTKRTLLSIDAAVWFLTSKKDRKIAFEKVEAALCLIREYAPIRMHQICRDIEMIFVAGNPSFLGQYLPKTSTIELYDTYVLSTDTSVSIIASTLVHEAQHARLFRLGFGYDEDIRDRIERICIKAELNFGKLLSNGGEVIEQAGKWLKLDIDAHFTNSSRTEARIAALKQLDLPNWTINIFTWLIRWRSTKS